MEDWTRLLPSRIQNDLNLGNLAGSIGPRVHEFWESLLYRYALFKVPGELRKIVEGEGSLKFHVGLNKYGLVNVGITISFPFYPHKRFEDLCREAYGKVAHLQEDPLINMKNDLEEFNRYASTQNFWSDFFNSPSPNLTFDERIQSMRQTIRFIELQHHVPRLVVSYFQAIAITVIYSFLWEKLRQAGNFLANGWTHVQSNSFKEWKLNCWKSVRGNWNNLPNLLNDPWDLIKRMPDSSREDLPPLRHIVFMYQLVEDISDKNQFLRMSARAIQTLGNNVGWDPSNNPPFPFFKKESPQDLKLNDSSLTENSCCLIFPQGLVVVTPSKGQLYLGGGPPRYGSTSSSGYSPSSIDYDDYWLLIFKLFIRVTETRLNLGMINRYLSDCHGEFMFRCKKRPYLRMIAYFKGIVVNDPLYMKLIRVGWLLQRISENVVTPEISRFSFVRQKIISFMGGVRFEEQRGHIEAEFEKLNKWINEDIIFIATVTAIGVAFLAMVVTIIGLFCCKSNI